MSADRNYPLLLSGQFLGAFGDNAILAVIVGQLTYLQKAGAITAADAPRAGPVGEIKS